MFDSPPMTEERLQAIMDFKESRNKNISEHRFVFGLGAGLIYSLGPKWREVTPIICKTFDNDCLISAVDMPMTVANVLSENLGKDRLYIDSGGFTLFKEEKKYGADSPEFHKRCERMKIKYLKILKAIPCKETFELDNEYFRVSDDLLDPRNYCREEAKAITGFYPTPVFKLHQGFEYWKQLCESPLYPKLAIGGLAQTKSWHTHTDELKIMMDYARQFNKKVHLLGCQNVEAFKTIQPSTVDYSIHHMAINYEFARKERPDLDIWRDIGPHASLYAFTRAMSRDFLYDCFSKSDESINSDES